MILRPLITGIKWLLDSTARFYAALGVTVLVVLAFGQSFLPTQAASWDVLNMPVMYLEEEITEGQTTGIKISPPVRNQVEITFPLTTGAVLKLTQNWKTEHIYYTGATVDSDLVVTLLGVTRQLCDWKATTITSCGDGESFGQGSPVEVAIDARLINLKANVDRSNIFTAAKAIRFAQSGSLMVPVFATEAARNQALGATPQSESGYVAYVTGTGQFYFSAGGAWRSFSGSNVVNASTTVAGKVQEATSGAILARTIVGSTGAQNALTVLNTTRSGTTLADIALGKPSKSGYIPVMSGTTLFYGLIGTGGASGRYLRMNGTANPFWDVLRSTTSLTNSGGLIVNHHGSGFLVDFRDSNTSALTITGDQQNYHIVHKGNAPTIASCGSSTIDSTSTDEVGKITVAGSPGQCAVYFNKSPVSSRYHCTAGWQSLAVHDEYVIHNSSGFTITNDGGDTANGTDQIRYSCKFFE